ncbi:MAG: VWA domain-containing protein [Pirellulales bacterium]|nr:VWA domain-containing protein [Pirellulales bacterium]
MLDYRLTFQSPSCLLLLLLISALWWWSYRRLASLGPWRRWFAMGLRTLVFLLLVLALAEIQWVRATNRLTVLYLLDQSLSIPQDRREIMIDYVNEAVDRHLKEGDRAGVIVFGRDAAIEIPPVDQKVPIPGRIESSLDPENTNLAGAIRLAQATFPEDAAKRIVVVSDGNENLGDALAQAQYVSTAGVGIDVVPIDYDHPAEVIVERLTAPNNIRPGQPFDLKVVVENTSTPTVTRSGRISGRLVVSRRMGNQSVEVSNERVTLPPGKQRYSIRQQGTTPGSYGFEVRFIPDRVEDDAVAQNNRATAMTHIRGKGRVLLVEDHDHRGEFDLLVEQLRRQELEVDVQSSRQTFAELDDLQPYDTVVLANVPREQFTDRQIDILVHNTRQLGAGLVMLGGPNSFGAGGWTNTTLEEAMPVDFQIKNLKVVPSGALMLVIDRSGSMMGDKLEMCKAAAIASLKTLGPEDCVGVVVFDSNAEVVVPITRAKNAPAIIRRIRNIGSGGGTSMYPGMSLGREELKKADTSVKHMVVLSDGQTEGSGFGELARKMRGEQMTISAVAVGEGANSQLLSQIATIGRGKFHFVKNPKVLPRIFMQEARRIARPLIYRSRAGVRPLIRGSHDMTRGLEDALPPIHGYVMTTVKENPLVEVALLSPLPPDQRNSTILAGWSYGLGHAVAMTTDAGARWATNWPGWEGYGKLFGQVVRWSMRPTGGSGKFLVTTHVDGEQGEVILNALDKNDEFLNFLSPAGNALGPELEPIDLRFTQDAPGRYIARFPAGNVGSYFVVVSPGVGYAPIRTHLNVPYSREFRDRTTNKPLLEEMAAMVPEGGKAGVVVEAEPDRAELPQWLAVNTFRHDLRKATSNQEAWHILALMAGCLFFFDVLVRRVQVHFAWVRPALARVGGFVIRRKAEFTPDEMLDRLKNRKVQLDELLQQARDAAVDESARPAARFEAPAASSGASDALDELARERPSRQPKKPPAPSMASDRPAEQETYTERLLRAKKKVWDDRGKKP